MERIELAFVPEWLKNAGSSTGVGSISHTDDHTAPRVSRNKSFVNNNGHDFGRSDTSSYFRRSSSSNSCDNFRSYTNFGRKQPDRNIYDYHDQDKSAKGDHKHREFSEPLGNTSVGKVERDGLRRSQSMVSTKRVAADSNDAFAKNMNGVMNKAAFERDFPMLGAEERVVTAEAIQSFAITSTLIGWEKWTSALAEVPMSVGSNGAKLLPMKPVSSNSASGALSSSTSRNMAEAVAQGSSRAQATPQIPVGSQRLEELVIKQSRQLVPMTPLLPKASADKQKRQVGGTVKGDMANASSPSVGKLHVLKPARHKNGITPNPSPSSDAAVAARKPALTVLEKRTTSQARSRNDFFDLVRKKSMESSDSAQVGPSDIPTPLNKTAELAPVNEETSEAVEAVLPLDLGPVEEKAERCNVNGKKHVSCGLIISEEEEAAFLRSLGWEENDEEGGLTDEEISSFYRDLSKYTNSKPSLKIRKLKFILPVDSQAKGADGIPDAEPGS